MNVRLFARLFTVVALVGGVAAAVADDGNPPRSRTGAPAIGSFPAEPNCTGCHGGNALNTSGSVTLLSPPTWYRPGSTYRLTLQLASGQTAGSAGRVWGFQLTALDASGGAAGAFANVPGQGTMTVVGTGSYAGRPYVEVNSENHASAASPVSWQVDWTAPANPAGAVTFRFVGLAGNGTGSSAGDWVYTGSYAIADTTTPTVATTWGEIKARYR